ncbi:MAG: cyclic lactone autoinducer peptide [Desulfotomaculales bacterium]
MRRLKYFVLVGLAAALALIAQVGAASACTWWHYQPRVPERLARY